MKALKSLVLCLAFNALVAIVLAPILEVSVPILFTALMLLAFIPMPKGVAFMAVQREIWVQDIIENLFKNNEFAKRAFSEDQYVLNGKVVHIPVAGAPSTVVKNQTVFPQAAVKRGDTELTYAIDTYYTEPRHVEAIDKFELSYDKRQSVLGEDESQLIQTAMDGLLFRWAPLAANAIMTSGADTAASLVGAAGNRKAFTKDVFATTKLALDKANILNNGRVALLSADHFIQFFNSLSDAEKTNFHNVANLQEGTVGRYLGFDVMQRSSILRYRGATGAVVVVDEQDGAYAPDVNDRGASLFYQENQVSRALGDVIMFDGTNRPEYYGDIYSFILRLGGRIRRTAGVYAVVEELSA